MPSPLCTCVCECVGAGHKGAQTPADVPPNITCLRTPRIPDFNPLHVGGPQGENECFDQSRNGKWSHHTGPTRSLTAFLPIYLPGTHSFMLNFRPALSFEDHSPRAKTGVLEGRFLNGSEGQRFAFTWISVCTSCCPVTFAHRALAVSSMLSQHFSPREVYLFLMGKPATTTSLATEFYCRAWTLPDSFLQIFLPRDPHDSRPSTSYNEISL